MSEITRNEFVDILFEIVEQKYTAKALLCVPGVYDIISEELNNEVIEAWEARQEGGARCIKKT